jgi:outer membrane lipoprotein-sorting protein
MKVLLILIALCAPIWAVEAADKIFEKARLVNAGLLDYSADIQIQMRATLGFIPYNPKLQGRYLHRRPDKHKLELQNAPSYLKRYPNVFGFNLPDLSRYNVLRIQEMELRGIPCYKVMLAPKARTNDITAIDLYVNREDYTVPKYDTFYSKGHLYVDINFRKQDKYSVYDTMSAEFEFPSIQATATASYANYQFNQGLTEAVFK